MRGLMMDFPLALPALLERAGKVFAKVEIVSRRPDRILARQTWGDLYRRARRLASALTALGLKRGDRVATLMWNHSGHVEAYFGVPAAGGVLHTLNPRLHPNEISYIANHAGDRFLLVDDLFLPVYEQFRDSMKFERVVVVPFGGAALPAGFDNYEELLAGASEEFTYPALDENEAATMCYTSGTTGRPKGVVYSHRSNVLHSFNCCGVDSFAISQYDSVMPVASLFHANGWGVPYTSAMAGARLVLPGPYADSEGLLDLIEREHVTVALGVPTIWIGLLEALEKNSGRWKITWPVRLLCGGAASPEATVRGLDRHGFRLLSMWGMTETSPHASASVLRPYMQDWSEDKKCAQRVKQGMPVAFVEVRVMRPDGTEAPHDGKTIGELEARGPWVAASYYHAPEESRRWSPDGWLRTGDMGHIDEDGFIKLVDRSKDLIKSGGEWISSVDLENTLMGHPAVKEAAVIGLPHPKWQERPLAVVVLNEGAETKPEELREFLATKFAKWQLPDEFVFAKEIPRTSVGKFRKTALREQFAGWKWES
jgi:fatty-acyl-CoA synthase